MSKFVTPAERLKIDKLAMKIAASYPWNFRMALRLDAVRALAEYQLIVKAQETKEYFIDLEQNLWFRLGCTKLRWFVYPHPSLFGCPGAGLPVVTIMKDAMDASYSPDGVCPINGMHMEVPKSPPNQMYARQHQTGRVRMIEGFGLLGFAQLERVFMQDIRKLDWKVASANRNGDWYPNWDVWLRIFRK